VGACVVAVEVFMLLSSVGGVGMPLSILGNHLYSWWRAKPMKDKNVWRRAPRITVAIFEGKKIVAVAGIRLEKSGRGKQIEESNR
jgi:hypothetical protein